MKKYIYLIIFTLTAIGAILMSGYINNIPVETEVFKAEKTSADNTVTAGGKLQYGSSKSVISDKYCLIENVFVKNGDKVEKDDSLLTIYEAPDGIDIDISIDDVKTLAALISQSDLSDELKGEIKKYAVRKTIKAPQKGIISGLSVDENQIISDDTVMLKISDRTSMIIPINVSEANIEKIKKDQNAEVSFAAVSGKTYSGKVIKISGEAKQTSSLTGKETSVEVTVKLDNPDELLRIGYSAECMIITSTDKDIIIVPYEYIRSDEKGDYVFTAKNGRAVKTYIITNNEYKDGISVTEGLKSGDMIIKTPDTVYGGCKISISE